MKNKKILDAMALVDEKYIEEANPHRTRAGKRSSIIKFGALAASFAILMSVVAVWLFAPYNNTKSYEEYESDPYYPVIVKLGALYAENDTYYKNNFDKLFSTISTITGSFAAKDDAAADMGSAPSGSTGSAENTTLGSSYEETTDNQVDGVIEGDIIKRSSSHIYYLSRGEISVYSIEKEDSKKVGSFTVPDFDESSYNLYNMWEMYLSENCKTLTVVASYSVKSGSKITLLSLDVEDPSSITEKNRFTISGGYLSSRVSDGSLLLISEFRINGKPDFSNPESFIPTVTTKNGTECLSVESIIMPEKLTSARYTVVTKLGEDTLDIEGCTAHLSYSNNVYVSRDSIYVTRGYTHTEDVGEYRTHTSMTEISALNYSGDALVHKGTVSVRGYIKDQYSLDEYENILRVVTTTSENAYKITQNSNEMPTSLDISSLNTGTSASLYCIDLSTWNVIASVENFAPKGEVVQSVRFDKSTAYVCTSVQLSDPVFFFDLSDLENITYKDTGTIDGFSSSLINLGDGYLLGIGIGSSWDTVKIEIYEESEGGVVSVSSVEYVRAYYSTVYKSYLVDRENRLIGLGIESYDEKYQENGRYVLLHFNGYELYELVNTELSGSNDLKRAVYIDGYLYIFSDRSMRVVFAK